MRAINIGKEFADGLKYRKVRYLLDATFGQYILIKKSIFLMISMQKRSLLFYSYVLLLEDTIHILKEVADNKDYRGNLRTS